jgi:hypothetical protein
MAAAAGTWADVVVGLLILSLNLSRPNTVAVVVASLTPMAHTFLQANAVDDIINGLWSPSSDALVDPMGSFSTEYVAPTHAHTHLPHPPTLASRHLSSTCSPRSSAPPSLAHAGR